MSSCSRGFARDLSTHAARKTDGHVAEPQSLGIRSGVPQKVESGVDLETFELRC
jgi:hypothetical protein